MQRLAEPLGVAVVAVGFDPAPTLAAVAERLAWRGRFLADPGRTLHRRLGLRRAPWWRVWSPRTLLFYARHPATRPSADVASDASTDVRQMGGDTVVVDGVAVACWRPRTPVDRVDPAVLVAHARHRTR